jgi:hypothetical protein
MKNKIKKDPIDTKLKKIRVEEVKVLNKAIAFFRSYTFEDSLNLEQATNDLIISIEKLLEAEDDFFSARIIEAKNDR